MLDALLSTLDLKVYFLLFLSLLFCYVGAQLTLLFFRQARARGEPFVSERRNDSGEPDLVVEPSFLKNVFWPVLALNVACFILLMFVRDSFPWNMVAMAAFTFTDGITLGLVFISIDENLASKAVLLTALGTLLAGAIATYSDIDFAFLSPILFFALIGLLLVSIARIFIAIKGTRRRIIALIGVAIFVGYILYDVSRLKKLSKIAEYNTWNNALDLTVDIYLDIINLLLQILDLLSED